MRHALISTILGCGQLLMRLFLLCVSSRYVPHIFPLFNSVLATYSPVTVCRLGWKWVFEKMDKHYSIQSVTFRAFPTTEMTQLPAPLSHMSHCPKDQAYEIPAPPSRSIQDIVSERSCLFPVFHLQAKMLYCAPVLNTCRLGEYWLSKPESESHVPRTVTRLYLGTEPEFQLYNGAPPIEQNLLQVLC